MDSWARDLAEQLKNGQLNSPSKPLQKMADQLKSANLSDEQMQRIMKEVGDAVKPADNYGKVRPFKNASQQMGKGRTTGRFAIAGSCREGIGNLMQQMGDAQQMMAEWKISQSFSMRWHLSGWGMCNKPGIGTKPGRPGGGVGTWADEKQWLDVRWPVERSLGQFGQVRPDQDARDTPIAVSGELTDALKPTKVKGNSRPVARCRASR